MQSPADLTEEDEGERVTLTYQSRYHPDADRTEVEGTVDEVVQNHSGSQYVYIEDERGRILEVVPHAVNVSHDEDGAYVDRRIGDDPQVEVRRLYEVYVTGVTAKYVRAEDEEEAREKGIRATDFGDLHDSTDKHAASRTDEEYAETHMTHDEIVE